MNKNEFLQQLKNQLILFEETYAQEKVLFYDNQISNQIQSGMSEAEAIKSCGTIDAIVESIFKENHLKYSKQKKRSFLSLKYEEFFKVVNKVVDTMAKNSMKANMKILFDILVLILLTCVIKIPFILVRDLGENLLMFLDNSFVVNIWQLFVEVIYLVVAVTFFLNVFKKWFKNLKVEK